MSNHLTDTTAWIAGLLAEHREDDTYPETCVCEVEAPDAPIPGRHAAHVAAVLAEAGVGFVDEVERERDEWHRVAMKWVERCSDERTRAERAEAALADLRERVRALAAYYSDPSVVTPDGVLMDFRALLDGDA